MNEDTGSVISERAMNAKSVSPVPPAVALPHVERRTASYHSPESPKASCSALTSPPTSPCKRIQRDHVINRDALSLVLLFNGRGGPSIQNTEDTAPPAFFPQQRVSFSPRLRILNRAGLMLMGRPGAASHDREHVCSMLLGVTGIVETFGESGRVKSRRIVADFCTDLSSGVQIWRKDAEAAVARRREAQGLPPRETETDGSGALPPGTYVLPLSMRIPSCDRLPPSYESRYFRISYTMTLALLSKKANAALEAPAQVVKMTSVPFHILPSTLPTLPPSLPVLSYDERKGFGASIMSGLYKSLALATSASVDSLPPPASHTVTPSLPTSHFSPGGIVPLTLRIQSKPLPPNSDLYVRMSLVRKIVVRDSTTSIEESNEFDVPLDTMLEPYCRSQEILASRWAYIPSEHRLRGARRGSAAVGTDDRPIRSEVLMRDVCMPLGGGEEGWQHGYSTSLDLAPTGKPFLDRAKGSWFSPIVKQVVAAHGKDAERHLHVSTRFYVMVEAGFHTASPSNPQRVADLLSERKKADPCFVIPPPATFTKAVYADVDPWSSELPSSCSAPDMKPSRSNASWDKGSPASISTSIFGGRSSTGYKAAFPGTLRTLLLPITIGSVAEPTMQCVTGRWTNEEVMDGARGSHPADREEIEETPAERADRIGDDGEQSWIVAPPTFAASLRAPPAYL